MTEVIEEQPATPGLLINKLAMCVLHISFCKPYSFILVSLPDLYTDQAKQINVISCRHCPFLYPRPPPHLGTFCGALNFLDFGQYFHTLNLKIQYKESCLFKDI